MVVIFLQDHENFKQGNIFDVEQGLAEYWLSCGIVTPAPPESFNAQPPVEEKLMEKLVKTKSKKAVKKKAAVKK